MEQEPQEAPDEIEIPEEVRSLYTESVLYARGLNPRKIPQTHWAAVLCLFPAEDLASMDEWLGRISGIGGNAEPEEGHAVHGGGGDPLVAGSGARRNDGSMLYMEPGTKMSEEQKREYNERNIGILDSMDFPGMTTEVKEHAVSATNG